MSLLLAASAGAAFLASFTLLHAGVRSMAVRYGVAALTGYVALLALFRLWLREAVRRIARRARPPASDDTEVLDLADVVPFPVPGGGGGGGAAIPKPSFGGGGGFSGGGGGSSWGGEDAVPAVAPVPPPAAVARQAGTVVGRAGALHGGGGGGRGGGVSLDLDEGWAIVIPIVALVGIVVAAVTVVVSAPSLFAELLLDGLVAAGIYRRLRRTETHHWLAGAVRRTWIAALAAVAVAAAAGWLIQAVAPKTVSIGDLWR